MYQNYCEEDFTKKETREGGNIEMKENLKKEKGITLIALIITIIILVILAAVSIRAVYNMGIVDYAINGTQNYARAAVAENEMLSNTESLIDETLGKLNGIQGTNSISEEGTTLVAALKAGKISIGDYINYEAPEVSATYAETVTGATDTNGTAMSQTFSISTENSNKMGWRVLGYGDSNGKLTLNEEEATNVLLIAANPIQQYLVLGKEYAYLNGPTIMNDLSSKFATSGTNAATNFSTDITTARSVNIDDINTALGITIDYTNKKVIKRNGVELENYEIGTYTYENNDWVMGDTSLTKVTDVTTLSNDKKTVIDTSVTYEISPSGDDVIGHMLLDETEDVKSYWLASRGIDVFEINSYSNGILIETRRGVNYDLGTVYDGFVTDADSFLGLVGSDGRWYVARLGVRPVVSLGAGIKYGTEEGELTKLTVTPTGWTGEGYSEVKSGKY